MGKVFDYPIISSYIDKYPFNPLQCTYARDFNSTSPKWGRTVKGW